MAKKRSFGRGYVKDIETNTVTKDGSPVKAGELPGDVAMNVARQKEGVGSGNRYFTEKGEVSKEEFGQEKSERKIVDEQGGHKSATADEIATREGRPTSKQEDIPLPELAENIPIDKSLKSTNELLEQTSFGQAQIARRSLESEEISKLSQFTLKMRQQGLSAEQVTDDPMLQNVLKLQLSENDLKVLNEGKAKVSIFNQLIESFPPLARVNRRYLGLGIPSAKVDQTVELLEGTVEQMNTNVQLAKLNPMSKKVYENQNKILEQKMHELESRIKLISIQSPLLQGDPEEVDKIMMSITSAKEQAYLANREFALLP